MPPAASVRNVYLVYEIFPPTIQVHFPVSYVPIAILLLLPARGFAFADSPDGPSTPEPDSALRRAEALLELSHFDRALRVLDSLYLTLQFGDRQPSYTALRVRLRRARVYERTNQLEKATAELLSVLDESRVAAHTDIAAEALLLMALIYEQAEQPDYCQRYLRQARNLIEAEGIDSLRSRLEIRTASYHRIFGDPYRARLLARRALRYADRFDQSQNYATAHLLLSLLYRDADLDKSESHLLEAARAYQLSANPVEYVAVMTNLANVQYRYGRYENAVATTDSVLNLLRSPDPPAGLSAYVGPLYRSRARALRALGSYDSAFHYLERGQAEELKYLRLATDVRVLETQARYNEEKREQLFRQQEQQLRFAERSKSLFTWLMVVALVGLGVVLYSYLRMRRANRKLGVQSRTIQLRNEQLATSLHEQRLLQGEVHHRVRNNLQIVISLLDLQREETDDRALQRHLESMAGRVYSMAAIHEVLYQGGVADRVDMRQYTEKLCHNIDRLYRGEREVHYLIDITQCTLNLETAVPLGTVLNELLTNSFKYAKPPDRDLRIRIGIQKRGEHYELRYRDNGTGYPDGMLKDRQGGLGTYLLKGMSRQLSGRLSTYNEGGAVTVFTFSRKINASGVRPSTIPIASP